MPFFDDSGPRPEEERGLLWHSVALIGDQLERMILLNIAWAVQLLPALAAWAFLGLPGWLRIVLTTYTAFAFIPASAVLFDSLAQTSQGVPLSLDFVKSSLKTQFKPSLVKLLPLYSLFFWLVMGATLAAQNKLLVLDVLARASMLFLALFSLYWGTLFVYQPHASSVKLFSASARLVWRRPGKTLLAGLISLLALVLGVISIGGLFLIVPVLVVLIQVQLYHAVHPAR